jgi:hypothetical protein
MAVHIVKILEIHNPQMPNMNLDEKDYFDRLEAIFKTS